MRRWQKPSRSRTGTTRPRVFLSSHYPMPSALINFLNCTKNIELTARPFPRTVTFALTQKIINSVPRQQVDRH
jgi:hypothetical protein